MSHSKKILKVGNYDNMQALCYSLSSLFSSRYYHLESGHDTRQLYHWQFMPF